MGNKTINKLKRVLEFLTLLTVEPYIFLTMFVYSLKKVTTDQLIQDKICLQRYNLNASYCYSLPHLKPEDDYLAKKEIILEDVTQFSFYTSLTLTLPSLLAAAIVGSWTDKYIGAKKALMIAGAVGGICEALILIVNVLFFQKSELLVLFSYIPSSLSGGLLAVFTAMWAYIAATTPTHLRSLRMTIVEIAMSAASPLGTFIGGKVLNMNPLLSSDGQLHNYSSVYIIGGVAYTIALLWAIFMINEMKDIQKFNERFNRIAEPEMSVKEVVVSEKQTKFEENKDIHPLKLLFNFSNVKDMIDTCCKRRTNYVRLQIWLLFLSMVCYFMSFMGPIVFLYPFTQEVYEWNSEQYSNASAIGNVVQALGTIIVVPLLIKVFKIRDTNLTLIGLGSYFAQNMIRAFIMNGTGFYISLLAGALGSVTSVGIRAHLAKVVTPKELGKVFSLMSTIDSLVPLIASAIFTEIFDATIDTFPAINFIINGALLIIPVLIIMWIDLYTVVPDYSQSKSIDTEKANENLTAVTKM